MLFQNILDIYYTVSHSFFAIVSGKITLDFRSIITCLVVQKVNIIPAVPSSQGQGLSWFS